MPSTVFSIKIICLFTVFFVSSCGLLTSSTQQHWPSFGGPNGNNQLKTKEDVPTRWSVRKDENIQWRLPLPAGGQSGISIWGDKLFLTINMPADTEPRALLEKQYEQAKAEYQRSRQQTIARLNNEHVEHFQHLLDEIETAKDAREQFSLERSTQKLRQLNRWEKLKHPVYQAVTTREKNARTFLFSQEPRLQEYYRRQESTYKKLNTSLRGKDVLLYCVNRYSGELLWQRKVAGVTPAMYNYTFSDATSPSPVTDGNYVWVVNASGGIAAFDMDGNEKWRKTWTPSAKRPFNKQYDTIAYKDWIFNVAPPLAGDQRRNHEWNYLHAINKYTGDTAWVSEDALTHYNTPMIGKIASGKSVLAIGRGGPHSVPERPNGVSLIGLDGEDAGKSIWQWHPPENGKKQWGGTDIQTIDEKRVVWTSGSAGQGFDMYQINPNTGMSEVVHSLNTADVWSFNLDTTRYELAKDVELKKMDRQPYTQVVVNDKLYYMVRYQPFIAFHDLKSGKNIHLEIPTEVHRKGDTADKNIWKTQQTTDMLNTTGQRHNTENRALGDGTQKAFLGTPIVVNQYIYFTNAHGLTYVIDTSVPFGPNAFVSLNDIGEKNQTASLNTMAYASGMLYHRSIKELIAIATK